MTDDADEPKGGRVAKPELQLPTPPPNGTPIELHIPPAPPVPVIAQPPTVDREASTLRPHESQDAVHPLPDGLDGFRQLLREQNEEIAAMIAEHEKREGVVAAELREELQQDRRELRDELQKDREWLATNVHNDFVDGLARVIKEFWEPVGQHSKDIATLFERVDTLERELKDVKKQLTGLVATNQ